MDNDKREKRKAIREGLISSLIAQGYITPDEATAFRDLKELPKDRKGLATAYYLLGIDSRLEYLPSIGFIERTKETLDEIFDNYKVIDAMRRGEENPTGMDEAAKRIENITIQEKIKWAETYINARRGIVRDKVLKFLQIEIAVRLSKPDEGKEDCIVFLRDLLREKGYNGRSDSLNDKDRRIIREAAVYYLDLMELSILNGTFMEREEEYKSLQDEEGDLRDKYYYRDVFDEVLLAFDYSFEMLSGSIVSYTDNSPKGYINLLREEYDNLLNEEDVVKLKGGKFSYLLEE